MGHGKGFEDLHVYLRFAALDQKHEALQRVRKNIDVVSTPEYGFFLETLFGPLQQILQLIPPSSGEKLENKVRHLVLEIFTK